MPLVSFMVFKVHSNQQCTFSLSIIYLPLYQGDSLFFTSLAQKSQGTSLFTEWTVPIGGDPYKQPLCFSPYHAGSIECRIMTNLMSLAPSSEKAMAPHSSTLAWKTLWTEEPGR